MNLVSSRLPLLLVASGGILIIVSFLWGYVVPTTSINEEQVQDLTAAAAKGHEALSVDPSRTPAARPDSEESQSPEELAAREKNARAVIQRARFMRERAPKLINYVGVVLAAVGCILYPLQLLARQAKVEAEREEEDGTTVVE